MFRKQRNIVLIVFTSIVAISIFLFSQQGTQMANQDSPQVLPMQSNDVTRQKVKITENEFNNIQKRNVKIENSIGSFTLREAETNDHFILETISTNAYKPKIDANQNGTQLALQLKVPGEGRNPHMMMGADQYAYRGTIGQVKIPTEIDFTLGAGEAKINLAQVPLSRFVLTIGAGSADVSLEKVSIPPNASVLVGTGSLVYTFPKDVGVEVDYKVATGNFTIANEKLSGEGIYRSDNFDSAKKKVKVSAIVGSGSIIFTYK